MLKWRKSNSKHSSYPKTGAMIRAIMCTPDHRPSFLLPDISLSKKNCIFSHFLLQHLIEGLGDIAAEFV